MEAFISSSSIRKGTVVNGKQFYFFVGKTAHGEEIAMLFNCHTNFEKLIDKAMSRLEPCELEEKEENNASNT